MRPSGVKASAVGEATLAMSLSVKLDGVDGVTAGAGSARRNISERHPANRHTTTARAMRRSARQQAVVLTKSDPTFALLSWLCGDRSRHWVLRPSANPAEHHFCAL